MDERRKKIREERRSRAMAILGGVCSGCGNGDQRVLQIYSVKGRHETRYQATRRILSGDSNGYCLLCANCTAIREYVRRESEQESGEEIAG